MRDLCLHFGPCPDEQLVVSISVIIWVLGNERLSRPHNSRGTSEQSQTHEKAKTNSSLLFNRYRPKQINGIECQDSISSGPKGADKDPISGWVGPAFL